MADADSRRPITPRERNHSLAAKRKPTRKNSAGQRRPPAGGGQGSPPPSRSAIRVRKLADGACELVPPRCARDRQEDIEEVRKMIEAGETEIAQDELRWLLGGCSDFIDAHRLLGELALAEEDLPLARGHFGYAYSLGSKALEQAGTPGPLPYHLPANQAFHEAAKGLVYCLLHLGKRAMAADVVEGVLRCDPSDPLAVRKLLQDNQ